MLANVTLKVLSLKYGKYINIVLLKENVSSFCNAKASHIFCCMTVNLFQNTSATTVNEFVINKFVKLAVLLTTGP